MTSDPIVADRVSLRGDQSAWISAQLAIASSHGRATVALCDLPPLADYTVTCAPGDSAAESGTAETLGVPRVVSTKHEKMRAISRGEHVVLTLDDRAGGAQVRGTYVHTTQANELVVFSRDSLELVAVSASRVAVVRKPACAESAGNGVSGDTLDIAVCGIGAGGALVRVLARVQPGVLAWTPHYELHISPGGGGGIGHANAASLVHVYADVTNRSRVDVHARELLFEERKSCVADDTRFEAVRADNAACAMGNFASASPAAFGFGHTREGALLAMREAGGGGGHANGGGGGDGDDGGDLGEWLASAGPYAFAPSVATRVCVGTLRLGDASLATVCDVDKSHARARKQADSAHTYTYECVRRAHIALDEATAAALGVLMPGTLCAYDERGPCGQAEMKRLSPGESQ